MSIKKVGVLGSGLMGSGIAEIAAKAGFDTVVREVSQEVLDKGLGRIRGSLDKAVEKGKLEAAKRDEAIGRLRGTTGFEEFADCDLVVEAIVENIEEKPAPSARSTPWSRRRRSSPATPRRSPSPRSPCRPGAPTASSACTSSTPCR